MGFFYARKFAPDINVASKFTYDIGGCLSNIFLISAELTIMMFSDTGNGSRSFLMPSKNQDVLPRHLIAKHHYRMQELVIQSSKGNEVTTSLIVAEVFKKEHSKVLRDIENLSCSEEFRAANFGVSSYTTSQSKQLLIN